MNKGKRIVLLFLIVMSAFSCSRYENGGFPSKVFFPADGGEMVIFGNDYPHFVEIRTYDGKSGDDVVFTDDSIFASNDWLELRAKEHSNVFELKAAPNSSQKKRKLYIDFYSGPNNGTTIVEQLAY